MSDVMRRRLFLIQAVRIPLIAPFAALVPGAAGCTSGLDCTDTSALTGSELTERTAVNYVEVAADPAKRCENCSLYKRADSNKCGACTLIKGPINPAGTCTRWAMTTPP